MTAASTRILIAASDRKIAGGDASMNFREAQASASGNRFSTLTEARATAVDAFLSGLNGAGHAKTILRMDGGRLSAAVERNEGLWNGPTLESIDRYSGPLFTGLDCASLESAQRKRVRDEFVIVSPLLGLLGARDRIPDYRCPVGAQVPGFGSLHGFWKARVGNVLSRVCRNRQVFSFLPGRLKALWVPRSNVAVCSVEFVKVGAGSERKAHAGAAGLGGELLRAMVEGGWTKPRELRQFESSCGHAFDAELSEEQGTHKHLVFALRG